MNLSSVCRAIKPHLADPDGRVDLVCSGTGGAVTREDVLLAGAIADRLSAASNADLQDSAVLAADAWRSATKGEATPTIGVARLAQLLQASRGGRNCLRLGLAADIDAAATIDCLDCVPVYDPVTGRVRLV